MCALRTGSLGVSEVYHETQSLMRCGVHCVNNVVGRPVYTAAMFDDIVRTLGTPVSWAYRLGLGNYDVNVLAVALQREGYVLEWWDRRKEFSLCQLDGQQGCVSVIVNRRAGMMQTRHWICLKKVMGVWYNLDSRLGQPLAFSSRTELDTYVQHALDDRDGECMLVRSEPVVEEEKEIN
jgi:hypothetical protein